MKRFNHFVVICAAFAVATCDPMPDHLSKNYQGFVPEVVSKLNTIKSSMQVLSDQTPIVVREVQSCYNHFSDELQLIRTNTAKGIEKCGDSIYIGTFYTYQGIQDYVSSIQKNIRFIQETFKAHCENASYFEYLQCFADSIEETQNARIAIEKNIVEIYNIFAPRMRDLFSSSKNCLHSVMRSAVNNMFEISCQKQ